jgi:hypothetical protein
MDHPQADDTAKFKLDILTNGQESVNRRGAGSGKVDTIDSDFRFKSGVTFTNLDHRFTFLSSSN